MGKRQQTRMKREFFENKGVANKKDNIKGQELSKENMVDLNDYSIFFTSKSSKKMILYDKYPNLDHIISYYSSKTWNAFHPLEEYGRFDIKELVEIIKVLYSIQRQRDYEVLTMGYLEESSSLLLDGKFEELISRLYFLVGDEKTLEDYQIYQNLFLGEASSFTTFSHGLSNFIALCPKMASIYDTLNISCQCPGFNGNYFESGIQYYDYYNDKYAVAKYLASINIFDDCFYQKINTYKGIQDTLSFPIHLNDDFIAKVLISIVIYKKNHQKIQLSNDDYRYIFYELFKEHVNIEKEVKKDIPRTLKYVSNR